MKIPRLMIAAPSSGSGKSVITAGLMAALSQSRTVQGFKVGPDYIDPMYHSVATGRPSHNLDSWMLTMEQNQKIFAHATLDAEIAIIEGVMGLFDGYGSNPFLGSSAEMAKALACPVISVIDCGKMSGSAAAIAKGLDMLEPDLRLAGVICNRVGSPNHAAWLKEAIETYAGVPVVGAVPKHSDLQIPERQLGLFTVAERPDEVKIFLANVARLMAGYLDIEQILKIAEKAPALDLDCGLAQLPASPKVRLGVARDEAFCFYYEANFERLRQAGAELVFFSPLHDAYLPENIAGLYIGGGYPELYAQALSQNLCLMEEIRLAHQKNMPIYAECGGFLYLTEGIESLDGPFGLVGLIPGWAKMSSRLTMGYRQVEARQTNLLSNVGQNLRGHEFHYSEWQPRDGECAAYDIAPRRKGAETYVEGWVDGNLLASYVHLHFLQDESITQHFVNKSFQWSEDNHYD